MQLACKNYDTAGEIGRSHEAKICPKIVAAEFTQKTGSGQQPLHSGADSRLMGRCYVAKPNISPRNRVDEGWA